MITEQAIVTRTEGRQVEVELIRESACGHCELSQGCGTGAIGRLLGRRKKSLILETDHPLQPGDRIKLGVSEGALVKSSLMVYGTPLLAMLLAGMVTTASGLAEWQVAIACAAGLLAGFRIGAGWAKRLDRGHWMPSIEEIG